ncbi:MAG: LPS export ABC transporter permease LptG [Deltaproteobacteria bacterium]|nr:MAG: LPS export ABC transporter permease LptG [Deltaproteobacteria bacterium]
MKILERYLLQEFTKIFFITLGALLVIFSSVEALERMDTVLEKGASLGLFGLYMLMKVPIFLFEFLPFAVLIATVISIGVMARRKETLAMKVTGVSNYRLLLPFMLVAIVCSGVVFLGFETVNPKLMERSDYLWDVGIKKEKKRASFQAERVWLWDRGRVYNVRLAKDGKLFGLTILYLQGSGLKKRIEAKKALWEKGKWQLKGVEIFEFGPLGIEEQKRETLTLELPVSPEDFLRGMKEPEEMSFSELRRYTRKLKKEGYEPAPYIVSLHAKLSYPLSPLVLILVGVPVTLWAGRKREGGIPQGIALSVLIGGLYFMTFALTLAMGQGKLLPPWLSAWGANIFFAALGLYLMETLKV